MEKNLKKEIYIKLHIYAGMCIHIYMGFPGGSDGKESACNAGDLDLIPGLGRFPWRRAWRPNPVFFPGESP